MIKRIVVVLVLAVSTDAWVIFRLLQERDPSSDFERDDSSSSLIERLLRFRNLRAAHVPAQNVPANPAIPTPLRAPRLILPVVTTPAPSSRASFGTKFAEVLEVFFIVGLVFGILIALYLYRSHNVPLTVSGKVLRDAVKMGYSRVGSYGSADQRVAE